MRFSLLVQAAPDNSAAFTALSLAKALHHHPEHHLYCLFFYRDGVSLAHTALEQNVASNTGAAQHWRNFVQQSGVNAVVCVAAAQRRGIHQDPAENRLASGFNLAGLGEWADAQIHSDRVIQIG